MSPCRSCPYNSDDKAALKVSVEMRATVNVSVDSTVDSTSSDIEAEATDTKAIVTDKVDLFVSVIVVNT